MTDLGKAIDNGKFAAGLWRSREDRQDTEIIHVNQCAARDTSAVSGTNRNNGLATRPGHCDCEPTKENAATSAKVNGVKTSIETIQFPHEFSPEWAGAPAIILRHFCGVAV